MFIHTFILALLCQIIAINNEAKLLERPEIGDRMPDVDLPILSGAETEAKKISDFKGKALLLDFWSIWCGSCVQALPKLHQIQTEFQKDLTIIPVSFTRSKSEVKAFYDKMARNNRAIKLPTAIFENKENDLTRMFPSEGYPLVVWIDREGIVRGISDAHLVTAANVQKLIKGEQLDLPLSRLLIQFDAKSHAPTGVVAQKDSTMLFSSKLSPHNPALKLNRFYKEVTNRYTRIAYYNTSVVNLMSVSTYKEVKGPIYGKRTIAEDTNLTHLFYPNTTEPDFDRKLSRDTFCYELTMPAGTTLDKAFEIMNREIGSYFDISSSIETRNMPCWLLKRTSKNFLLNTKEATTSIGADKDIGNIKLVNRPIGQLVSWLSTMSRPIIIDETGYLKNIDVEIKLPVDASLLELNNQLNAFELELEEGDAEIEVLVLK